MSRSRIWWISTAAVLCTAVPALAYSWPALFGVPGAFGQEASSPAQMAATPTRAAYTSIRPTVYVATSSHGEPGAEACEDNARCPDLGDCLSAWQRLWERGEYARALGLARSAVQAAPRSLAAQHAVVVSQILNDIGSTRPATGFEEAEAWPSRCPAQTGSCPLPLNALFPTMQMPLLPAGAQVCSEGQQPLFIRHFETPCGSTVSCVKTCVAECAPVCAADEAKGCCEKCAKDCKCCCTKANKTKSRTASLPTTIFIVREPIPVHVPAPHVVPLPPPPVFSYAPAFPPMPSVPVGVPVSRPAPAVVHGEYQVVGEEYTVPPSHECEAAPLGPNAHVRILQRGGMCFVSSPNFEIRCDRVRSNDGDRLVLEGKVTLVSRRHGQTMTIEAERITLNVATDQFQIDNARGVEQTRFNVAPVTAPVCPPTGYYQAGSAEESNVSTQNPRIVQLHHLLTMRKSEREAYEQALMARWKEVDAGKAASSDFLLEAISRFVRAVQRERETVEEYEALREESRRAEVVAPPVFFDGPGTAAPAPTGYRIEHAPVRVPEARYEAPAVVVPSAR
jgi:hypothetical protein